MEFRFGAGSLNSFSVFPNARILTQGENGWNSTLLTLAKELETPNNITMTLNSWENDSVSVTITNTGDEEWGYGEHFHLEVLLDDVWYSIPATSDMCFTDIGLIVQPGEEQEKTYNLSMYGELPVGTYRLVAYGLSVENVLASAPDKAPSLEVTLQTQSILAIQGTTSWSGINSAYESDSPHPLQLHPDEFDRATIILENGSGELKLQFSNNYPPQEILIKRWLAEYATGNQDIEDVYAQSETVEIVGNIISIVVDENDYIYEIYARWTNNFGSSSRYSFRTVRE